MKKLDARQPALDSFLRNLVESLNTPQGTTAVLNQTAVTPSAGYSQSEAQQVATNLKVVADKLDVVIDILKKSNILSA